MRMSGKRKTSDSQETSGPSNKRRANLQKEGTNHFVITEYFLNKKSLKYMVGGLQVKQIYNALHCMRPLDKL